MIPRGDRSDVIVEPLITDQWYVRMQPLNMAPADRIMDVLLKEPAQAQRAIDDLHRVLMTDRKELQDA